MKKLFKFQGRANRAKYFGFSILGALIVLIPETIAILTQNNFMWLLTILLCIPCSVISICLMVQRFHDIERPGTHYWLLFIPVYNLYVSFLLLFKKGTNGPNYYGEDPLALKEVA